MPQQSLDDYLRSLGFVQQDSGAGPRWMMPGEDGGLARVRPQDDESSVDDRFANIYNQAFAQDASGQYRWGTGGPVAGFALGAPGGGTDRLLSGGRFGEGDAYRQIGQSEAELRANYPQFAGKGYEEIYDPVSGYGGRGELLDAVDEYTRERQGRFSNTGLGNLLMLAAVAAPFQFPGLTSLLGPEVAMSAFPGMTAAEAAAAGLGAVGAAAPAALPLATPPVPPANWFPAEPFPWESALPGALPPAIPPVPPANWVPPDPFPWEGPVPPGTQPWEGMPTVPATPGPGGANPAVPGTLPGGTLPGGNLLSNLLSPELSRLLGPLISGGLGYLGAGQQADAAERMQNQYLALGAPSRARFEASYAPGFSMTTEPGYKDALDQASQSMLRKLAVQGNPHDNPGLLGQGLQYTTATTALPALQNYRGQLASAGQLGVGQAGQGSQMLAQNAGSGLNAIGYGANQIFNPPTPMDELLRQLNQYRNAPVGSGRGLGG